ncbi:MAG: 1-phosphofructokinase [Agathobacter sp.]|uniref:1-phosphofructokinase n=1 Tax=Agathobacter sp. TaxID=2021311 RepID=UPI002585902A|nr:1-phosphofructokinase [Agathobacter sp.]MCR5677346.1 1-phosphofructokinase [Agathobacter sp.]
MIYTVTFNPSLDYIIGVDHFKLGQVNRTKSEVIFPGGKGINVSMVLKNMGIDSVALGFCGGFTGEEFVRLIQEKGIKTELIKVKEGITRINVKMKSDEESEINGQGPNILPSDIEILYHKLDQLKDGDILVLAGSIPDVMPKSIYMDIMEYLKDKKIDIVVDATKNLLVNVLKHKPFLVKPNNHELGEIYGVELKTRDEVVPYAKKMQETGARNVLVSMAGEGAVLLTEDGQVLQSEAPKGTVVNSVGAGDSMVAGFITGYLDKKDYKEAFAMGVCTGSASAFSVELATKAEVEALRKNNQHLF